MMELLDGKRIVNNIYAKAKELDLKIGDIEKDVPVSLGYFSRFLKDDNHAIPGIESLFVAASKLNVTMDFLLLSNFSEMNEEELLLQNKISIMISKTRNGKYSWNEITEKEFYEPIFPSGDYFYTKYDFSIVTNQTYHYNTFGDVDYAIPDYHSIFLDKVLDLDGSIFCLELGPNEFYISKVSIDTKQLKESYYEMYVKVLFDGGYEMYKMVNSSSKDKFYSILDVLYKTCALKSQEFKLDIKVKNALNSIK